MASVDLEYNQGFKIYKGNTWFNNLVLHKATYETVVMSLGDKISGIVYYKNNKLVVDMTEYIMYKNVKYVLVNPPTVIKEGLVSDNGELKGMTKYSFTFYHPMYMLSNFPFSDVAVDDSQKQYLSQNKTFSWIGNLVDYKDKLNKNLEGTQWKVSIGTNVTDAEKNKLSEVLSFDNNTIADALKTAYETWEIPYIVDKVEAGTQDYLNGKLFVVQFGLPSNEIYKKDKNGNFILDDNNQKIPFVFKYGQGVGLKNNSRTPKNNKIVTRIAGYGSEDNIPYGYPQIVWTGNQDWNYTINNASGMQTITVGGRTIQTMSYPIYDGIVGGQKVRLIKHPFTRTHLMPPIYKETVNKKVNPNATDYNPNTELVDYYDANGNTYPNQIKAGEPSYEIHEFEDIKPEFDSLDIPSGIYSATPYDGHSDESISQDKFLSIVDDLYTETDIKAEKTQLNALRTYFVKQQQNSVKGTSGNYEYDWSFKTDGIYKKVKYTSSGANFEYVVKVGLTPATIDWDDTMDEQGNYVQSYFEVTIPALGFDLYASAAITQEMTINMRSGACIGCSFPVMVDWDDYKRNFYDKDGNFAPNGTQRNLTKYPNSTNGSITLILQKETNTFGTLMPNIYQKPASGDKFVILGISLPTSYITTAEGKLETEMKKYMRDNNVYYYEYPLKFDEHFLISNEHILSQMKPNVIVNFEYADVEQSLYIKQMSIKYNESPLPKYDITLTDDVDVVLNKIGEAIAEYRGQRQYENGGGNSETLDGNKFLRKDINDTASGTIRMLKGLQVGERFVTGLLGEGGIFRKDDDGTTYLECDRMYVRMKAYFDTVEVRRFLHSGGNRIASAAGMKCSRVEYIAKYGNTYVVVDANGRYWVNNSVVATLPIERYRCYFRAEDNGAKITNDFVIGDLAYCKETNIDTNLSQHGYWRAVVDVSGNANANGEHWIDLSKSDCSSTLNDVPIAQDDIIQLGNKTDKTRQGAIIEYVSGEDAPSYQIYQGINTYDLNNKNYIGLGYSSEKGRAYMNVYGDMFVGVKPDAVTGKSPTYIEYVQDDGTEQHKPKLTIKGVVEMLSPDDPEKTTTLDDFAKAITGDIEYLQQQIDGEIDTWFYDGEPALNKYPASEWTTDTEKKEHLGDLYYDKLNGNAYRFIYDKDSETYSWLLLSDSAILEALRIANEAKDTADHKRRVFLTDAQHPHPTPPYDEGDLWVNAVWPYEGQNIGSTYNDEFLKCTVAKAAGQGFAISDWSRTSTHAENVLQDFIEGTFETTIQNIKNQVDHKVQTWYQSTNPADLWESPHDVRSEHVGDLWYCTTDIEDTNFKKDTTWQYVDNGEGVQPRYQWKQQNVPEEIFDKIDGKRAIYSEWGGWMTGKDHQFNQLQEEDLFIPQQDTTQYDVTFKANKVYRCTNAYGELIEWPKDSGTWVRVPRFQEIAYTDDSAFSGYINAILNGTGSSGDAATVAAAQKAIKDALGGGTTVDGGLLLTSLIAMRKYNGSGSKTDIANYTTWAGISGVRKDTETGSGWKGYGIAAWYGGAMVDHEVSTTATDHAKSLFRFDGSGYLAGGNITWDKNGIVTIANVYANIGGTNTLLTGTLQTLTNLSNALPLSLQSGVTYLDPKYSFTNLSVLGKEVATKEFVSNNYVPLAFFNALFAAFSTASPTSSTTPIDPSTWTASTVINNLKIKVGTWTEQYLSALGNNPNASGGGGISDLSAVLNELNSKDDLGTGVLVRNGLNNWSWMPYNAGSSGIDENAMWTALSTSGNQKIDNSHLSLKSLTFKVGASDANGVVYSPTGDANKTITFDAKANSGISVEKDSNGTFIIGYTMPNVTLSTTISDSDTSYTRFVVDAQGRVIKADKPTTLAGYGITDAKIDTGVITLGSNTITPITDAKIKVDYTWWGQKLQTTNNKTEVKGTLTNVKGIRINDTENKDDAKHGWIDFHYAASQSPTSNIYEGDSGRLVINEALNVIRNGNVGIGTNAPSYKLDVNGNGRFVSGVELMHANTIKARLWSDNEGGNLRLVSGERWVEIRKGWKGHYWEMDSYDGNLRFYNYTDRDNGTLRDVRFTIDGQVVAPSVNTNKLYLYKPNSDDTGAIYLEYIRSGSDKGVHLAGDGLWVDGFVSALGTQSSGGQDYFNADLMWQELGTTSSAKKISQSYLDLSGYALTDDVTKSLTIKQTGKADVVYNGTQAKEITISAGTEAKNINDGAGTLFTDVLASQDGTFFFYGNNLVNGQYDWVGIQVENKSGNIILDKGQLVWSDGTLLTRQDDGSGWTQWATVITDKNHETLLSGYAKTSDFKSLTIKGGEQTAITYNTTAASTLSIKAGSGIAITTTNNEISIARNALVASDIPSLEWSKITTGKPTNWWGQAQDANGKVNGTLSVDLTTVGATTLGSQYSVMQAKYKNAGGSEYGYGSIISLIGSGETDVAYNMGVRLGSQTGMTWISAGESGSTLSSVFTDMCNTEDVYVSADSGIHLITGVSNDSTSYVRAMDILSNGNVGIGMDSPATTLHVSGVGCMTGGLIVGQYKQDNHLLYVRGTALFENSVYVKNSLTVNNDTSNSNGAFIKIGKLYLIYDNDNNAIKVSGSSNLSENTTANIYATGAVSALGSQSSSGGSSIDLGAVWDSLSGNSDAYGSRQISIGHLTTALNGYLTSSNISTITFRLSSTSTLSWNPAADSDETIDLSSIGGSVGSYVKFAGNQTSIGESSPFSGATEWATTTNIPNGNALVYNNSGVEYSLLYSFSPSDISNYGTILKWSYTDTYIRIARNWRGSWRSEDWEKISAGYADKIPQHSFWGQTFDGTGDVSGNMSGVGSISMSDNIYIAKTDGYISISSQDAAENFLFGASSSGYIYGSVNGRYLTFKDGNVGVGAKYNPAYKLEVVGSLYAESIYRKDSSDSYVLLGGGGHSLISGLSVNKAKILDTISSTEDGALLSGGGLGLFSCGTSSTGTTDGQILTVAWSNNWQTQLFVDAGTTHSVFIRNYSNGTFNDWKYIVTEANIGNQSVNYATGAGNADTIDNFHANGLFQTLKNSTASGHSNEIEIGIGNATKYLTVGYSTNAGTATTASKLSTVTKKAWGQTYWTSDGVPQDISGNMTGVGTIAASGNIEITKDDGNFRIVSSQANETYMFGASSSGYIYGSKNGRYLTFLDGKIGIGISDPQYKLEVVGNSYFNGQVGIGGFSQNTANKLYVNGKSYLNGNVELSSSKGTYIQIGDAKLTWTDNGLECDKDFYSTGAVSALGSNTSGGGGGISDISVSASLSGTRLTINVSGQTGSVDLSSISGTSGNYIPLSGSDAITGDLKPLNYNSAQDTGCDLGNDSKRWRQIWGKNFIGETIELLENKIELNFRATQHNNFGCKVGYRTYGDEALVFANKNASTSFIFYTGSELITDENNTYSGGSYGTPALQIKQNSVYINRPIINGVSPSYELYVNGRSYADEVWVGNYQDNRDVYLKRYNTQGGGILDIMAPQGARLNATTTVTSDMRLKNIVSFVDNLTVEGVAMAPIFNFKWKDRPKGFTCVGTSAQYWQSTLPNVVIDLDNILSLDYGATALASAVITARKVVDHELRIKQLEQENAILRKEIEELKAA